MAFLVLGFMVPAADKSSSEWVGGSDGVGSGRIPLSGGVLGTTGGNPSWGERIDCAMVPVQDGHLWLQ